MSTVRVDANSASRGPVRGRAQKKTGIAVADMASAWAAWVMVSAVATSVTREAIPTNSGYRRL